MHYLFTNNKTTMDGCITLLYLTLLLQRYNTKCAVLSDFKKKKYSSGVESRWSE